MTESNLKTVHYHGIELKIKEEKMDEYISLTNEIDEMFRIEYAKSEEARSEIVRYFTRYFRLNPFEREDISDNYHLESLHTLARMLEVHDIKFFTSSGIVSSLGKFGRYHARSHNNGVIEKSIKNISREVPDSMLFTFNYEKLGASLLYGEDVQDPDSRYDYITKIEDDYYTIIAVLNRH